MLLAAKQDVFPAQVDQSRHHRAPTGVVGGDGISQHRKKPNTCDRQPNYGAKTLDIGGRMQQSYSLSDACTM